MFMFIAIAEKILQNGINLQLFNTSCEATHLANIRRAIKYPRLDSNYRISLTECAQQ